MTRIIPPSELIINDDGSVFHLKLKPEQLADHIIMVGDPARVTTIATYFDRKECDVTNREFHTITGNYKGKRITVISHGIGGDNIDIVITELDALANIDFATRTVKPVLKQLTIVRIGTSGGLQPYVPIGTYVAAHTNIGFDGIPFYYAGNHEIRDLAFEEEFIKQVDWKIIGVLPYAVKADEELLEQIAADDFVRGVTIATNSFYGAQGRMLRLSLADPELNKKIEAFNDHGIQVTNFEMESAALASLAAMMGHRALTVCCIIAGRVDKNMNTNYKDSLSELIEKVLERI